MDWGVQQEMWTMHHKLMKSKGDLLNIYGFRHRPNVVRILNECNNEGKEYYDG